MNIQMDKGKYYFGCEKPFETVETFYEALLGLEDFKTIYGGRFNDDMKFYIQHKSVYDNFMYRLVIQKSGDDDLYVKTEVKTSNYKRLINKFMELILGTRPDFLHPTPSKVKYDEINYPPIYYSTYTTRPYNKKSANVHFYSKQELLEYIRKNYLSFYSEDITIYLNNDLHITLEYRKNKFLLSYDYEIEDIEVEEYDNILNALSGLIELINSYEKL